jgi:hypothetical protein
LEKIDNTLAHQACGRAGRRGHDKEGNIIYAGVDISNILIPKYSVVTRNTVERMNELLDGESDEFKNYILNEVRPEIPETIWKCINSIDIDKLALEMYNMQTIQDIDLTSYVEDDEYTNTVKSNIRSLEQIKEELVAKITFKPKVSVPSEAKIQVIEELSGEETNVNKYVDEENSVFKLEVDYTQFASWEDAFDAMEEEKESAENKKILESKKAIALAESSFM